MIETKGITSRDIAERANVSVGTVYRVLSNEPTVDEARRARVLAVIKELGYVHVPKKQRNNGAKDDDSSNKSLNEQKTFTFCLPNPQLSVLQDAYFYHTLHGAQLESTTSGVSLLYTVLPDTRESLREVAAAKQRGHADGLILVNYGCRELIEGISRLGIPLVVIDPHYTSGLTVPSVISDYFDGAYQATQHLVKLGHQNIAIINSTPFNGVQRYTMQQRLDGYRIALLEAGLPYRPELVIEDEISTVGGERVVAQLIENKIKFTALFCANDATAIGAIRGLQAAGLKVPDDVSVVGLDDHEAAALLTPALTTIHSNNAGKGATAIKRLLEQIARPSDLAVRNVLPVYLVERASTAPVSQK